jgi:hypothetical protein
VPNASSFMLLRSMDARGVLCHCRRAEQSMFGDDRPRADS